MNISGTITGLPAGVAKKKNDAKIPVNMFMQRILPPPILSTPTFPHRR